MASTTKRGGPASIAHRSSSRAHRETIRWIDHLEARLPGPLRRVVERARGDDILLFAAGLGFYAIVSIVPLTILMLWVVSLALGDARLRELAGDVGRAAPANLGADTLIERVAELGTRIGVVAIVTGLWPATAYGSGLRRAFDRLSPRKRREARGLRGRWLLLIVVLPVFVVGSLVSALAASHALGSGSLGRVVGYALALAAGFLTAGVALVLIYRTFPPSPLGWRAILRASAWTATGVSLLSVLFVLYLSVGANFQEHYATSGLGGLVLLALWLFLSNVLLLVGYKIALETG
jgi:membrane protein